MSDPTDKAAPVKSKGGRPTDYTVERGIAICARMAEGESLRSICRDEAMPSLSAVMLWLGRHEEFLEHYTRARDARADAIFEEVLEIADTPQPGVKKTVKPDGKMETVEGDMVEHRRLRVDARKWVLARMAPKKYGDRLTHAGDAESPINLHFTSDDAKVL